MDLGDRSDMSSKMNESKNKGKGETRALFSPPPSSLLSLFVLLILISWMESFQYSFNLPLGVESPI